uniref:Uncharacterized protein n=1 Tax=Escherichia coli TaxID=562 RepID=A0A3S9LU71_ECOLX|nr:hypothetical protein [Escherichia coli]
MLSPPALRAAIQGERLIMNKTLNALVCRHARNLLLAQGWPKRRMLTSEIELSGLDQHLRAAGCAPAGDVTYQPSRRRTAAALQPPPFRD